MTTQTKILDNQKKSSIITTGFALFSMFFGAGNLIFPLLIGKATGQNWIYAIIGLMLTAIIVPFLGLISMILFEGDCQKFLGRIGKKPGFCLLLLLQLILGPIGVIPRLFTLMHAILKPYLIYDSLAFFSIAIAILVFLCSRRKQNLIQILGAVLTPILLISLICLFTSGFVYKKEVLQVSISPMESFLKGFIGGYNTMDLMAAFLFATVVLPHFKNEMVFSSKSKSLAHKKVYLSSLIAGGLLLITYIGICFISCYHAPLGNEYASADLLSIIAHNLLGPIGGFIAAITIVTACLTTAITLTLIFAQFLQKDILHEKLSFEQSLVLSLLVTIAFANLGFNGIAAFLSPILEICYPGLITLTILNILHYYTKIDMVKFPVFITFFISAYMYIR